MVIMFFDHRSTIVIPIEILKSPSRNLRKMGHFMGIIYDEFSAKYWPIFDTDNSGTLNFEENMHFYTAVLDGAARLVIKVRKLTC